jgi:TrmH family RNA methyltransferase
VLEGAVAVTTALDAGADLQAVYVADGAQRLGPLLDRLAASAVPVRFLAPGVVERVADTVTPQPVLAVAGSVVVGLEEVPDHGFVLVGVDVADPGNVGTMVRTAEATGAAAVVLAGRSADVTGPKAVRASAGALFHLPVVVGDDAGDVLDVLGRRGRRRYGAVPRGGTPCDRAALHGDVAIVVGNEAHGLADDLPLDERVSIPMAGRAESLNVAMAATVLCYEAARQRRATPQ